MANPDLLIFSCGDDDARSSQAASGTGGIGYQFFAGEVLDNCNVAIVGFGYVPYIRGFIRDQEYYKTGWGTSKHCGQLAWSVSCDVTQSNEEFVYKLHAAFLTLIMF